MNFLSKRLQNQSGQALLLVLLSMAVILTVVLSILSRSILDVAVTTGEEEALRAFSAAEAGMQATASMRAKVGRGSYRQDGTVGVRDGGATAMYFLVESFTKYLSAALAS